MDTQIHDEALRGVAEKIAEHLKERISSLTELRRLENDHPRKDIPGHGGGLGFEAWLKVEVSKILGSQVLRWEAAPGLILDMDGVEMPLDIKTTTDANFDWIERGFINSDIVLALLNEEWLVKERADGFKEMFSVVSWQMIDDGIGSWILMIARKKQ